MIDYKMENISEKIKICVSKEHTFGTDSFLLSDFAAPKRKDITCDLGSGCGIIPLLWFRDEITSPKFAYMVDIQQNAANQAAKSVELSGLKDRITVINQDIRTLKGIESGSIDLVTCNPPYKAVGSGILSSATSAKIARHEVDCTIDDVCACAGRLLRFGGRLCLCQLTERLVDVIEAMRKNKIEPKRIRFVQKDINSPPWLFLIEGKRGAKPCLVAEPPVLLYKDNKTSDEMKRIYNHYGRVED